ncbi:MAG: hypothetical protein ACD_75C00859G0002 [uncultured bacterium]|nr:MAG: hypothetical protein ACD_75C00859G0002 [uncultured bacterium]
MIIVIAKGSAEAFTGLKTKKQKNKNTLPEELVCFPSADYARIKNIL